MTTPTPIFPQKVDSTMAACLSSCEQMFFNEFCLGLVGRAKSPDLHAGGALAEAFQTTRRALWTPPKMALDDAIIAGLVDFTRFWGDYEPPDKRGQTHPKTYHNTAAAFVDYWREYPPDTDPIRPYIREDGTPTTEYTFAIPMNALHPETGEPLLYCGRFDLLGYYNNLIAVIDEKSTYALSENWAEQWNIRGQFIGYCFACQYHSIPCNTAIIRGIGIQKTQVGHMMVLVQFQQWQIDRWWIHTNRKFAAIAEKWKQFKDTNDQDVFTLDFGTACGAYGGCTYQPLCQALDPSTWLGNFEERRWDPLDKQPGQPLLENVA